MRKPTFIALAILALMLGACASTNDTSDRPEHTTQSNNNPTEIPSHAERQDQIAYSDISESASTKEVVTTEKQVLVASSEVTNPPDQTMVSSSTSTGTLSTDTTVTDDTATMSGSTSTSTTTTPSSTLTTTTTTTSTTDGSNSSMTSSSTTDDTDDDDDTATATRTRMRKD